MRDSDRYQLSTEFLSLFFSATKMKAKKYKIRTICLQRKSFQTYNFKPRRDTFPELGVRPV